MKKLIFLLLITAMETWGSDPQVEAQTTFQKTFGPGTGYCIRQTTDGNLIMTGDPCFLIKMDQNGNVLWHNSYSSVSGGMTGSSVEQTTDGGFIIGGTLNSGGPTSKVALLKTDSNGNFQWAKSYGGTYYESGSNVKITFDGGYIIVGSTASFGIQFDDIYIIKTDGSGNLQWSKTIHHNVGDGIDVGNSIVQTNDSGYAACGRVGNILTNSNDAGLIKLDKNGNLQWANYYGGTGSDEGQFVTKTSDDGYIIAGYTDSFGAGGADAYMIKTDSTGNLNWSKTIGGPGNDFGYSIINASYGDFVLTGTYDNLSAADVFLSEIKTTGDTLWAKVYGDNGNQADVGYCSIQYGNNLFSIGQSNSFGGTYVIKTDSLGNSGCNQSDHLITVTTPSTVVTTPSITVSSPATIVNSISFTVSSISTVSTLCSLTSVNEIKEPFDFSNAKLVGIYDVLGQEVGKTPIKPNILYIYKYEDKYGNVSCKKVMAIR